MIIENGQEPTKREPDTSDNPSKREPIQADKFTLTCLTFDATKVINLSKSLSHGLGSEGGVILLAQLNGYGKAGWLGLTLVAVWAAWPLGLAMAAFVVPSGRTRASQDASGRWLYPCRTVRSLAKRTRAAASWSSRNQAFNTCRTVGLNQLNIQEIEFRAFLDRLCLAWTNDEFDRFVAEQRHRGAGLSSEWSGA